MLEELNNARVEGLTFIEFQPRLMDFVSRFVRDKFKSFSYLKYYFGISPEDVESQVYVKLCNRKTADTLSNLERYFISASKCGLSYLSNVLRRVVSSVFIDIKRSVDKGKYSHTLFSEEVPDVIDTYDYFQDISYRDILGLVPDLYVEELYMKTPRYYGVYNSKILLELLLDGYSIKEISKMVFLKDGSNVNSNYISSDLSNLKKRYIVEIGRCVNGYKSKVKE
jgi:hypothetical protein